jgi:large subunit ribosomal protein L4
MLRLKRIRKMPESKSKIKNQKSKIKIAPEVKKSTEKVSVSVSAPLYDIKGAKDGTVSLPKEVFAVKINKPLMAQAVRIYLANQRQGNAKTKTRGEIDLTKAKWFRQKGTGRARHGAQSAPIFVGGGVAHGPKLRDYSLKMPQKMKKAALFSSLSLKASEGEIKVISGLTKIEPKTKNMSALIIKINDDKKSKTKNLLVISAKPSEIPNVYKAGRNIKNLEILSVNLLNTYEVLKYKNLLIMKESIGLLSSEKMSTKESK